MNLEFYIPKKIQGLVNIIWQQYAEGSNRWTVLPSGKIELLFQINKSIQLTGAKRIKPDQSPLGHFCFMSGLHTRPLEMSFEACHVIGIQMNPIAMKALFGIPLCEIRDFYLEGFTILSTLNKIEDRMMGDGSFSDKAKWLEEMLYSRINETPELHLAISLSDAIDKYIRQNWNTFACSFEDFIGYSRTHTFRLFNDWFGISAHSYQKLLHFVQSVHDLHNVQSKLTKVGHNNNYFDQAHFIHSFRKYADITPGEYRRRMTQIPGQILG